jgi:hypothetical protein
MGILLRVRASAPASPLFDEVGACAPSFIAAADGLHLITPGATGRERKLPR